MSDTSPAGAPSPILPGTYTVATLPTPNAIMLGMYAQVSDLFGEKTDLVLCSLVGTTYFWQPVRPQYAKTISGNANLTLVPLQTLSTLILNGSLTSSRTYTLSNAGTYPGCQFDITFTGTLGVNTATLAGLDAGATVSLLLNAPRHAVFDAASLTWKLVQF